MNPSDIRICLDVQAPHGAVELDAKQGDSQRRIFITLTDGGVPYRITEDCRPLFTAKKPDGTVLYNLCQVENNMVVYSLTRQTTACPGRVRCEVRLYSSLTLDEAGKPTADSGELLTAAAFTLLVHPQVCSDGDILASATESTQLQKLVNDTQTLITQVQTKLETGEFVGEKGNKGDKGDPGEKGEKGDRGDKGDPGQVNIDDTATGKSSTWSSEKIAKFVEETSAVIEVSYDEASDSVWVTKSHAEIAALVDQGAHLQVQLFFMKAAGEEILAVNGMWMKRDLYGDAFVFSFNGYGDVVVRSDDTALWISPPGNVRYDAAQKLNEVQRAQARENIGAVSELSLIDKLCPAFTESGAVVTCEAVEGYPLTVTAEEGATITRCGKNLIPYPYTYGSIPGGGVSFTVNDDGSITLNGTATAMYGFTLMDSKEYEKHAWLKDGVSYQISASGVSGAGLYLSYKDENENTVYWYVNRGPLVWKAAYKNPRIYIQTTAGTTYDNATIYPQLEIGNAQTAYAPCHKETFTSGQPIPALPGVNTLWADNGAITVSGRADLTAKLERLENAILTLGANV